MTCRLKYVYFDVLYVYLDVQCIHLNPTHVLNKPAMNVLLPRRPIVYYKRPFLTVGFVWAIGTLGYMFLAETTLITVSLIL